MSKKSNKKTFIIKKQPHPNALTLENFFTRDDAKIVSDARKGLEIKEARMNGVEPKMTNQLKRFLEEAKKESLKE